LVSGIFFKAKIDDAVKRVGRNTFCSTLEQVDAVKPALVIVDLEHPEAHMVLAAYGKNAIAFGPHVQTELLAVAREFGAKVYPRSVFFSQLDNLLHQRG
jgi:hypothetical protein